MGNIAEYHGISYDMLAFDETEQVSVSYVDDYLSHKCRITHVAWCIAKPLPACSIPSRR